jgi:hypothetical protein
VYSPVAFEAICGAVPVDPSPVAASAPTVGTINSSATASAMNTLRIA